MTKTKNEILKHLNSVPYTKKSGLKIVGFLHAEGFIELGEKIGFCKGDGMRTFSDFIAWYADDSENKGIFVSLIKDLEETRREAMAEKDDDTVSRISKQLMLLAKSYLGMEYLGA